MRRPNSSTRAANKRPKKASEIRALQERRGLDVPEDAWKDMIAFRILPEVGKRYHCYVHAKSAKAQALGTTWTKLDFRGTGEFCIQIQKDGLQCLERALVLEADF